MLTSRQLGGVFAASPTLLRRDASMDAAANGRLFDYLIDQGIAGLVPLGGTGEYGSMSGAERSRYARMVVDHVNGRVPVIPGILSPGFGDALEVLEAYGEFGADAAMVVTPYYTNPTQKGMLDYFTSLADRSPLPILLYDIPYRTRIALAPEVIGELSRHDKIIGMKACNLDMYAFLKTMSLIGEDFAVLSGEDTLFPIHVASGAKGGVLATASIMPKRWKEIQDLVESGDLRRALARHRELIPLIDLFFEETNPGPMKSVLDMIGIDAPGVYTPLLPAAADLRERLRTALAPVLGGGKRR